MAVGLGVAFGLAIRYGIDPNKKWGHYTVSEENNIAYGVAFIGYCYTSVLKSLLIPLIIPAVIIAFGSLEIKTCWKAAKTFAIYSAITTIVSNHIQLYSQSSSLGSS